MLETIRTSGRRRFLSLAVTGALLLSLVAISSNTAGGSQQASADDYITGAIPVEVTRINGTVPLILGGTVLILDERAVSTAPVRTFNFIDGFESLDLHFKQSSIEQFTSTDFETARAVSGNANGTITATDPTGQSVATGSYKLSMSNTRNCQMKGRGTWSMESDKFTVSGKVTSCVNWDPSIDNFTGTINVEGDVEMKEVEPQDDGLIGGLVNGLLGGLLGR